MTVDVVVLDSTAAVKVAVLVAVELATDAGETPPVPAVAVNAADAAAMAVPSARRNVTVRVLVLWPSASTVVGEALTPSVMPLYVIVALALKLLYVAVTVAVPSVAAAGAV